MLRWEYLYAMAATIKKNLRGHEYQTRHDMTDLFIDLLITFYWVKKYCENEKMTKIE
jgi:hypothetical protein